MKIDIKTFGIAGDPELRRFVERRVESAFGVLGDRIDSLLINLTAVDEARDRKDKSCSVRIDLRERHRIIAEVLDSDLRVAIHRAVDRAAWTAARRLQRRERAARRMTIVERHLAGARQAEQAA